MERMLLEGVTELDPNIALATICMLTLFAGAGVSTVIIIINKVINNASKLH